MNTKKKTSFVSPDKRQASDSLNTIRKKESALIAKAHKEQLEREKRFIEVRADSRTVFLVPKNRKEACLKKYIPLPE